MTVRKHIAAVQVLEQMGYVYEDGAWQEGADLAASKSSLAVVELEVLGYLFDRKHWRLFPNCPLGRLIEAGDVMFRLLEVRKALELCHRVAEESALRRALAIWQRSRRLFVEPILTEDREYWPPRVTGEDSKPV
jgi:hypothetical protein